MVNHFQYTFISEGQGLCSHKAEDLRPHTGGFLRLSYSFILIGVLSLSLPGPAQRLQVADQVVLAALPDAPEPLSMRWTLSPPTQGDSTPGTSAQPADSTEPSPAIVPMTTMFPHSTTWPVWISGQTNFIFQLHPNFHSPYQGVNSFTAPFEYKVSMVGTLFTGLQVPGTHKLLEVLFDEEAAGGRGLSQALGLAGFTNLDVVRNPNLGSVPYVARWVITQTIPLSRDNVELQRGPFSMATEGAARRLVFHLGKMSVPDLFDQNSVGSDSHLQFTNWAIDNNGAWDYAADTRGYTRGIALEYFDKAWSARYGFFQMPTVANGIDLDWAFSRARGQNAELEIDRGWIPHQPGKVRLLGFWNNGHMGNYREAIHAYLDGEDAAPDVDAHAHFNASKYGGGLNMEQSITSQTRVYGRFGWNEGQQESYCYTEIDQTFQVGFDHVGDRWGRPADKVGVAFASNAISKDHSEYLKLGGHGFILGDGTLNYGRENILESYYNLHVWRGLFYALGFSYIDHPGYNRDRGPVYVPSVRAHVDF